MSLPLFFTFGGLILYTTNHKELPLVYCREPDFIAKRIEPKNGIFTITHIFKIENDSEKPRTISATNVECGCVTLEIPSTVIPVHSHTEVKAKMTLQESDFTLRRVEIQLWTDNNTQKPLRLSIAAAVQFTPFFSEISLNLGTLYVGYEESKKLYVYWPDIIAHNEIVSAIKNNNKNEVSIKQTETISSEVKGSIDKGFFMSASILDVSVRPKVIGEHSTFFDVILANGKRQKVNVKYNVLPSNCFIPEEYYFSGEKSGAESRFSVTYISDVNDLPVEFYSSSTQFVIAEKSQTDGRFVLEIEAKGETKSNSKGEKHEIFVKLTSGKVVKMPILLPQEKGEKL